MTTTIKRPPTSQQFARVVPHKYFKDLIKEARRVNYIIEGEPDFYQVKDDETNDLVFSGIRHSSGGWLATFSKLYWQEPELLT